MTKEVMATMAWFHWLPVLCLVVTGVAFLGVMEAAFAPTATLLYHGFGWTQILPFWMQTTLALLATVGGMLSVAAFLWASAF